MLFWFIAITNYGVLVPDDWRHVLAAVAGLALISLATIVAADGDHHTTPWQPSFQEAVVDFFTEQRHARGIP
jgi:hypothetical protein